MKLSFRGFSSGDILRTTEVRGVSRPDFLRSKISEEFGITGDLLALSFARLADAFGNGLLIIVIPLYLANLKSPLGLPPELLTGIVLASYGFSSSIFQPFFGRATDKHWVRENPSWSTG